MRISDWSSDVCSSDLDLDLSGLAAERVRDTGARHRHQLRAHQIEAEVAEVLLGKALTGQRELDDRHRRGVVVEDQWLRGAGRDSARKRVVSGKRRSVRLALGGHRSIKIKQKTNTKERLT